MSFESTAIKFGEIAQSALMKGDTPGAKVNYSVASSAMLIASKESKGREAELYKLSAAIYSYLGGNYKTAEKLINKIRSKSLTEEELNKLDALKAENSLRLSNGYASSIKNKVQMLLNEKRFTELLILLKENIYFFSPILLTSMRRDACKGLGKLEIAEIFEQDLFNLKENY
jgi:hypothetical protein